MMFNGMMVSGALLAIGGMGLAYLRAVPVKVFRWIESRFISTLELDDKDPAHHWMRAWLAAHLDGRRMRNVRCLIRYQSPNSPSDSPVDTSGMPSSRAKARPVITLIPGRGVFWVKHNGIRFLIRVSYEELKLDDKFSIGRREHINIMGFGRKAEGEFNSLLQAAFDQAMAWRANFITVYFPAYTTSWAVADEKTPRPPDSLVFDDGLFDTLLNDLRFFLTRREWYVRMGIPWRRGVMLKGPPGNGKTSLVLALAGTLGCDVRVINLSDTNDANLVGLMAGVPAGDIVLLEDIDAAFDGRDCVDKISSKLTFSGLLNAIDGVSSKEGRILFMTTNHPEKLDSALTRNGRIDVQAELNNASRDQAIKMYQRFFPDARPSFVEVFADHVPDRAWSMATIQEILLCSTGSPERAIDCAKKKAREERDARLKPEAA